MFKTNKDFMLNQGSNSKITKDEQDFIQAIFTGIYKTTTSGFPGN